MSKKRKQYSASFKSKVALATLKGGGDETTSEIATRFQVHPTMVSTWKRELLENAPDLFEGKQKSGNQSNEPYHEIGRLTVERDFYRASSVSKPSTSVGDDRAWSSPDQNFPAV